MCWQLWITIEVESHLKLLTKQARARVRHAEVLSYVKIQRSCMKKKEREREVYYIITESVMKK